MPDEKHIIYCILDWGLGHATRSVPLIQNLQERGFKITIATSGYLYNSFIIKELRDVQFLELMPYEPKYSKRKKQVRRLLLQIPHFMRVFVSDKIRIRKFIQQNSVQFIFSDNRFSCRCRKVRSVYLTHQVNILKPANLGPWLLPSAVHRYWMGKYDACLVPDNPDKLFKGLTNHDGLSKKLKYIGFMSRFNNIEHNRSHKHILVILSGPEPQRSIFENIIISAAYHTDEKIILVRGTEKLLGKALTDNVMVYNIAETIVLKKLLQDCSYVVCRSGYSSVMDLIISETPAIIVPTPGQSEQEYIAETADENSWFMVQDQYNFVFLKPEVVKTECKLPDIKNNYLDVVISEIV
ncbi:glycosyltransferase [Saccharicrinis sp. FJH2]|uniref:glycosyltransferase n=1 Tax=Saccharicrinis sp. FJH65 TaxID=3344659 RepID=UPI0035F3467A